MKKLCFELSLAAIFLFLFLYPSQALAASRVGLHLWFDTLLPTLLPFMILSGIFIRGDLARPLVSLLAPFFKKALMLSPGGTYALLMGFLCGCPMGAKTVNDLLERGQIAPEEAQYLAGFCNNLSPSFIVTFLVTEKLGRPALMLPVLVILYGSPLLFAILTNPAYRRLAACPKETPAPNPPAAREALSFVMVDHCILDSVLTVVRLGGYIMLFAILAGAVRLLPFPPKATAVLTALAEITNGIPAILEAFPFPAAFLLLMTLASFGGLSALAQTDSAGGFSDKKNAHLSLWKYVRSKLLISLIAAFLSVCFLL